MKFLFYTNTHWSEPPRARHQLAYGLSKKYEIIFIEANKKGNLKINIKKIKNNIYLISPFFPIDNRLRQRIPIINEIYQYYILTKIKNIYEINVVLNFDPSAFMINKIFKEVIYYCNDNFIDIRRSKNLLVSLYWKISEMILIKNSTFCIGVSDFLVKKIKKYNQKTYRILTGVDTKQLKINSDIKGKTKNSNLIIVYVGWLQKIDISWIKELSKIERYIIYLVGPYNKGFDKKLKCLSNVFLTGPKTGDNLNKIMINADVFIAPYKEGKDTGEVYTMPNKFWLYLFYGKPIVSRKINNLLKLPKNFVYQAIDKFDFIKQINSAIIDNTEHLETLRKDFLKKNTWDNRVEELINIIKKYDKINIKR